MRDKVLDYPFNVMRQFRRRRHAEESIQWLLNYWEYQDRSRDRK